MPASSLNSTFPITRSSSCQSYNMANVHPYMNNRRTTSKRDLRKRFRLSGTRSAFSQLPNLVLQNPNTAGASEPGNSGDVDENFNPCLPERSLKLSHRPQPEGQAADVAADSMQLGLEEMIVSEARKLHEELTRLTRNLYELNRPDVNERISPLKDESRGITEPLQLDTGALAVWSQQNPPPLGPSKVFPAPHPFQLSRNLNSFYSADDARDDGKVLTLPKAPAVRHMASTISRGFIPRSIFFSAPCRTVGEFSCENEDLVLEYTSLLRHNNNASTDTLLDSVLITSVSDHDSWLFDSTFSTDGYRSTMEEPFDFEHSAVLTTSKSHSTLPMHSHSSTMEQSLDLEHVSVSNVSSGLDFLLNSDCSHLTERDLSHSSAKSVTFVSSLSDCDLSLLNLSCPDDIHSSTWAPRPSFEHITDGAHSITESRSAKNADHESPSASSSVTSDPTFYSSSCPADCYCSKEPRPCRDEGAINISQPASELEARGSLTFVTSLSDCSLSFHSLSSSCPAGCRCMTSDRGPERVACITPSCSTKSATGADSFLSEESNYRADAAIAINNTSGDRVPPENAAFGDSCFGAHNPPTSKDTPSFFPLGVNAGEAGEMAPRRMPGHEAVKRVRFLQSTPETGEDRRGVSSSSSSEKRVQNTLSRSRNTTSYKTCLYRFITFSLPLRRKSRPRAGTTASTTMKQPKPGSLLRHSTMPDISTATFGVTALPNVIDATVESCDIH